MFYLICVWINRWVNNGEAGDLRRYHARYDVIVMAKRYDILPPDLANHNAAKCWLSDRFDIGQALLSAGETPVKFHYDAIIWNRNSTLWDLVVGHRTVWWIDVQYICRGDVRYLSLRWRHNENDCVSNHQTHHCLLNRFFGCRSKKISKLRVTGLCAGNSPHKGPVTRKMFPFGYVIMLFTKITKSTLIL